MKAYLVMVTENCTTFRGKEVTRVYRAFSDKQKANDYVNGLKFEDAFDFYNYYTEEYDEFEIVRQDRGCFPETGCAYLHVEFKVNERLFGYYCEVEEIEFIE